MLLPRLVALSVLLLPGISGCMEGHKPTPLERARQTERTTADTPAADLNLNPVPEPPGGEQTTKKD